MLFIATVNHTRRIVAAPHEAEAVRRITERYGFPDKLEVAPWYKGDWDDWEEWADE